MLNRFQRSPLGAFRRSPLGVRGRAVGLPMFYVGADYLYRIDENLRIINSSAGLTEPAIGGVCVVESGSNKYVVVGQRNGTSAAKLWRLLTDLSAVAATSPAYAEITGALTGCTRLQWSSSLVNSFADHAPGAETYYPCVDRSAGDLTICVWYNRDAAWWASAGYYYRSMDPQTVDRVANTVVWKQSNPRAWYTAAISEPKGLVFNQSNVFVGHSGGLIKLTSSLGLVSQISTPAIHHLVIDSHGDLLAACQSSDGAIVRKYDTGLSELATGNGNATNATSLSVAIDGSILATAISPSGHDVYLYDSDLTLIRSARRFGGAAYCCENVV